MIVIGNGILISKKKDLLRRDSVIRHRGHAGVSSRGYVLEGTSSGKEGGVFARIKIKSG